MATYIVSDGVESEHIEGSTPEEAAAQYFDGYDWGNTRYPLHADDCQTVEMQYHVTRLDDDGNAEFSDSLHGPQSDYRPHPGFGCAWCWDEKHGEPCDGNGPSWMDGPCGASALSPKATCAEADEQAHACANYTCRDYVCAEHCLEYGLCPDCAEAERRTHHD